MAAGTKSDEGRKRLLGPAYKNRESLTELEGEPIE
jgi:hypothetical protein